MLESRPHRSSAWLRERFHTVAGDIIAGDLVTCGHPTAHVLSLWERPPQLRCSPCVATANTAMAELDPAEDHTCDCCRQQVDAVRPLVLRWGWLLVQLGLCRPCYRRETSRDALG